MKLYALENSTRHRQEKCWMAPHLSSCRMDWKWFFLCGKCFDEKPSSMPCIRLELVQWVHQTPWPLVTESDSRRSRQILDEIRQSDSGRTSDPFMLTIESDGFVWHSLGQISKPHTCRFANHSRYHLLASWSHPKQVKPTGYKIRVVHLLISQWFPCALNGEKTRWWISSCMRMVRREHQNNNFLFE